jgi:transcriptional regulator with XRE-family HTH domain
MTTTAEPLSARGTYAAPVPVDPHLTLVAPLRTPGGTDTLLAGTGMRIVGSEAESETTAWMYLHALRRFVDLGTLLELPADPARDSEAGAVIQLLRERSGLTWQEIADALAVSRRAVHLWATGGRVSAPHARRIEDLARLVRKYDVGWPEQTCAGLRAPGPDGRSALSRFAEKSRPRRRVPLSTLSVSDVLIEEAVPPEPAGPLVDRTSRLAPRRLGREAPNA